MAQKDFRSLFNLDYYVLCESVMMPRNVLESQDKCPVLRFCFSLLLPSSSLGHMLFTAILHSKNKMRNSKRLISQKSETWKLL